MPFDVVVNDFVVKVAPSVIVSNLTPNIPGLIDSSGRASFAMQKWMIAVGSNVNNNFSNSDGFQGNISNVATIDGRQTLATIVQHISTAGVVQARGIDFALPYLNKDTDHITDGTGSPLAGGKAAYLALVASAPIAGQTIRFDGTDWLPVAIAVAKPAAANQWLNSYDAATGLFTAAQPAFTDISGVATAAQVPALSALSGQITTSQLPASGLSVTITTAALTLAGTQGSMTFTNGILTAQVQAT